MGVEELKNKILELAIRGKLVPQDPTDEPASVLLEKINKEKERLIASGEIRRTKSLPPISEEEIPFDIPEGWEWERLGGICQFINGDRGKNYPSKSELVDVGVPFINAGHLNNSEIEMNGLNFITEQKFRSLNNGKFQPMDIIYCLRGTLGKCSLNTKIEKGAIASSLVIIRNYADINKRYLYYYLISPLGKDMIEKFDNGTAQPNLSATNVMLYSIPIPPLLEQKRIVEKIDELFTLIDELDKDKEELLDSIEATRKKVLQLALKGKLVSQDPSDEPASELLKEINLEKEKLVKEKKIRRGKPLPDITEEEKPFDIPEGWEWARLGEIGSIIGGGTPKTSVKEYWEDGDIPWLTPADLSGWTCKYISRGKRSITQLGLEKSSAQLMPKGTVLFSSRAPIGYVAIAENGISTNQGFKSCIPYVLEMNEFIYYYLTYASEFIDDNATGTTFKEVSGAELSNLLFPLPTLPEQKRIVEKIDAIMALLDRLEEEINGGDGLLERLPS